MKNIILLLGNSHFAEKIISALQSEDNNTYVYCDTSNSFWHSIKYILLIPFASVVYSISGTINPGYALRLALKFKKKICLHYVGSDVTDSIKDFQMGRYSKELMLTANYAANAPWLVEELMSIGIAAKFISTYVEEDPSNPSVKRNFSVLTYLGHGKEDFYGLDYVLYTAEKFPNLNINVIGTNNNHLFNRFKNIKSHGWLHRDRLLELLNENRVMLRITHHDGLAHLVVDAMLCKNWVVRSNKCIGAINIGNKEEITAILLNLEKTCSLDKSASNENGFRWAIENCSKEVSLKAIKNFIFDESKKNI
jgi:hypothetical protein